MKKIYIIGPVGSGKTTLAKKLSDKLSIRVYELDKVIWDDDNGNIRRSVEERDKLFNKIIKKDSWIIEAVGRTCFVEGISKADIVYYINLNPVVIYKRCILRWIKQLIGIEVYNYKPTIKGLLEMLGWATNDIKNRNKKISYIKEFAKEYKCISSHDIKKLLH